MQVHHGEGLAIRTGAKPCTITREGDGEASAGRTQRQPAHGVTHRHRAPRRSGLAYDFDTNRQVTPTTVPAV